MSIKYHKIQSVFKRQIDEKGKVSKYVIEGKYTTPEFEFLKNLEWEWYEKIDGTNIRIMWDGNNIEFGGRTDKAQIPSFLLDYLENKFLPQRNLFEEIFGTENKQVVLFGEGYGHKIQAVGSKYLSDKSNSFIGFDINIGGIYLTKIAMEEIYSKLGINTVPLIMTSNINTAVDFVKKGFQSKITNENLMAEGLVGIPKIPLNNRNNQRIITKLKTKDFNNE